MDSVCFKVSFVGGHSQGGRCLPSQDVWSSESIDNIVVIIFFLRLVLLMGIPWGKVPGLVNRLSV